MATRLYLPSSGAAPVTVANDAWHKTAGAASAIAMSRLPSGTSMTTITNTNDGTVGHMILLCQFVSPSIPYARSISGKAHGVIRAIESAANGSHTLAFSLRVCSSDGGTIRTPALLAISASTQATVAPYEIGTGTATSSVFYDSSDNCYHQIGPVSASAGDRIVLEIGFRNGTTTTSRTGGIVYGDDSANDLDFMSINVATDNPWIEFSGNIFGQPGENYFS